MDQYPTVMLKLNPNLYVRLNLKLVRNNSRSDYIYFVRLRVLVDERSLEVYRGEKGQAVMSNVIFQQTSSDGISLATVGEGGDAQLPSVEMLRVLLWWKLSRQWLRCGGGGCTITVFP